MTTADPQSYYQRRLSEAKVGLARARSQQVTAGALVVLVATAILALGWQAVRGEASFWWPVLAAPVALSPALRYRRYGREADRLWRVQRFTEQAIERVEGDWSGKGSDGAEFLDTAHPYTHDLNIFGEGSLFERLSIARTGLGRRGLAGYLMRPASLTEIQERQDAVRELCPRTELREQVAGLGSFESSESQWATFARWLEAPPVPFPALWRSVLPFTAAAVVGLVVAGLLGMLRWVQVAWGVAPFLAIHSIAGLLFRERVRRSSERLHLLSAEIQVIREGLELLGRQPFESAKLRRIAEQVQNGAASVRRLERLLQALHERTKDLFYGPSLALAAGTQLSMAVEQWRAAHGAQLLEWLEAWGEFEALNALACYAFESPANRFPEVTEGQPLFEARAAVHPLLGEGPVANDVTLNQEARFYVISGSNMSGKSTLLRTIGLNAVLSLAGAPVRAESLRLSRFAVCASLALAESLASGRSRFMAEVERLKQAIGLTEESTPVLFLVDEIFSGTNSSDRRVAAEAVVRTLIERGAMGAISTHDLALAEIAAADGLGGVNVHMGSRPGGGPMEFDYLLKPGVTTETNALAIARMAGVKL